MPHLSIARASAIVALALPLIAFPALAQLPEVRTSNITVTEGSAGSADAVLTITLSAAASGAVTVAYATENLTATGGASCSGSADYVTESGTVQFSPGQTSRPLGVAVCGDTAVEDEERFRIRLSNAVGATIPDPTGRVTITNDDAAPPALPSVSIDDASFPEGNSGGSAANATVRLSATTSQPVTVVVSILAGGTATGGSSCLAGVDFLVSPPRTLTINPGQNAVTVPFAICGDTVVEPAENFSVSVVVATPSVATLGDGAGQLTISNDDAAPPSVSIDDGTFPEGNSGSTPRTVKVRLSAPTAQPVTVDVNPGSLGSGVTGGLCRLARDFNFVLGTKVTIDAGQLDTNVSIVVCGDTVVEPDETFTLVLANPTGGARLGDAEGRVTIGNDDSAAGDTLRADLTVDVSAVAVTQLAPTLAVIVQARNTGDQAASPVGVRTTLPQGVAFVRVEENSMGTCNQNSTAPSGAAQVNCVTSALVAGASKTVRIVGNVVGNIADSTQVVFTAEADPSNTVLESDEADNGDSFTMTVRAPSDLQISKVELDTLNIVRPLVGAIAPGVDFTFQYQWTVKNNGPYSSPPTTLRIEWPTTGVRVFGGDGNDIPLTEEVSIPALVPPASFVVARTVKFRTFTNDPVTAQVRVTVNPNQEVFDTGVLNNTSTLSVILK